MSVPQFKDISKAANNVLSKDFYHVAPLSLEVKTVAPNGVSFTVDGQSNQKTGALAGKIEAQYTDKPSGVSLTQGWTSANVLNTKVELNEAFTPGLKGEVDTSFLPDTGAKNAKVGLTYKQPGVNAHILLDAFKGPGVTGDVVFGHGGFVAGGEIAYDVSSAKISRFSSAVGYLHPTYSATIAATNNFNVFSAAFWHKVDPATEIGARGTWDAAQPSSAGVGIEAAVKHNLDRSAFVKAKLNNQGIAWLSYSQALRPGVTLGVGLLTDTQRLNESAHKVGLSLKFAA